MHSSRSKSSYPVVTFVVLAISAIGIVSTALKTVEPLPEPSELIREPDAYISRAANQKIKWKRWGKEVLEEAKRLDKPIFLLLGTDGSLAARQFDDFTLSLQDASDFLGDKFIFAREDIWTRPAMSSVLLPVTQARADFDPSLQIWILDSLGKPFYLRQPRDNERYIDNPSLQGSINQALRLLWSSLENPDAPDAPGKQQALERESLVNPGTYRGLSRKDHLEWLKENIDGETGTWNDFYSFRVYPEAWQFLLQINEPELLGQSTSMVFASGIFDWVEGGIYVRANESRWKGIEYDKYTLSNVEFGAAVAKLSVKSDSIFHRKIAELTFDGVVQNLVRNNAIMPYIVNTPAIFNRNERTSTSVKQLATRYTDKEQGILTKSLGLVVQQNPEMLPKIASGEVYESQQTEIDALLKKMRTFSKDIPQNVARTSYCDVSAYSIARLFETARLLNSPERIAKVDELFLGLTDFQNINGTLKRSTDSAIRSTSYLGDYLSMADAYWERYLAFGVQNDAERAGFWFIQAQNKFSTTSRGVLQQTEKGQQNYFPVDTDLPQIVDSLRISNSALAIRLAWQLSNYNFVISRDMPIADPKKDAALQKAKRLRSFAEDGLLNFGELANSINRRMSGLFRASEIVNSNIFVYITGPDSPELARKLMLESPTATIFFSATDRTITPTPGYLKENRIIAFKDWQFLEDFKVNASERLDSKPEMPKP